MMILWAIAGVPLGTYNIVEEFNIALRIQPQILTLLSLATWTQCMYYGKVCTLILSFWSYIQPLPPYIALEHALLSIRIHIYVFQKWPVKKCLITVFILCAVFGGVQAALIFLLRIAKHHEVQWPITMMAILSACLLVAGVLRHYWDIYIHRTVRGISFLFVAIDAAGDLFSLVSICMLHFKLRPRSPCHHSLLQEDHSVVISSPMPIPPCLTIQSSIPTHT